MKSKSHFSLLHLTCSAMLVFMMGSVVTPAQAAISQVPLFLSQSAEPLVMLTMSKDHQLFFKAYNDFSDLVGLTSGSAKDGIPETTYAHHFNYYGYFDSNTCYSYIAADSRFVPMATANADKYCDTVSGDWSGNFLNWVSMSRMDIVRKVLYGGTRSTDTNILTVLERASLPTDGHSWAKYYNGSDFNKLTPFSVTDVDTANADPTLNGITFCNTTPVTTGLSHTTTAAPVIQVAKGNFSLWDAHEGRQCLWGSGTSNGNDPVVTEINAHSAAPVEATDGLGLIKNYVARVEVCGSTLYGNEADTCTAYPGGNRKPTGLLQQYADSIKFGLLTGSYSNHIAGGVLRKNISDISNEFDANTGVFNNTDGIIKTINLIRVFGYQYDVGHYRLAGGDNCDFRETLLVDGECTSWGNPISEMFLETVRYFAGENPTTAFTSGMTAGADDRIPGLISVSWQDPLDSTNYCAALNTIVINASVSNFDGDNLGGFSDVSASSLDTYVDLIGTQEGLAGQRLFVGETGSVDDKACSPKTVANLSEAKGICPESGVLEGTYDVAGLAHFARTNDLRSSGATALQGEQKLNTYAVALSPVVPKINVSVDGKPVVILPSLYYRHVTGNGGVDNTISGGSLIDFKIARQDATGGKYLMNWEISSAGGDYDQDIISTLEYSVSGDEVTVSTQIIQKSLGTADAGIGYVISGTTQDGLHLHSGLDGFDYTDATGAEACVDCLDTDSATSHTYTAGGSGAILPEQPLYYAAKYGRFTEEKSNSNNLPDLDAEWDSDGDGLPDSYFLVEDPSVLVTELSKVLDAIARTAASAASVAANSSTLNTDTAIYQAQFNSGAWEGNIVAIKIHPTTGALDGTVWEASDKVNAQNFDTGRNILTYDPTADFGNGEGVAFRWSDINVAQQAALDMNPTSQSDDNKGEQRVDYLRGEHANEMKNGGNFRSRESVLGDFISSTPMFVGAPGFDYKNDLEGPTNLYTDFVEANRNRTPMIYAGSNDGMLHAFNASTGTSGGVELFGYIPNAVFNKLNELTAIDYTHQFYADGAPTVVDAFYGSAWHSVLAGGLRAGGQGYYALDVTDPAAVTEANAASKVLWEFTDAHDADMGYSFSQPAVVRMNNGKWAVIFGNGYGSTESDGNVSTDGQAKLFILFIEGGLDGVWTAGTDYIKISTGVGTLVAPNGLSTVAPVDLDGDSIVDAIYAGDLKGSLWKFDVSNSSASQWDVDYKSGSTPVPLFSAADSNGVAQPITVRPEIAKNPHGSGQMVYFGTGKYYEVDDDDITGATPQSFYGVIDDVNNRTTALTRANLLQQSIVKELVEEFLVNGVVTNTQEVRETSNNAINTANPANHKGWYMDLLSPPAPDGFGDPVGERVVTDPIFRLTGQNQQFPVIIFTTLQPSTAPCDAGGTGWLMELDARNGGRPPESVFDLNNDQLFSGGDETGNSMVVTGIRDPLRGIPQKPTIIDAGTTEYKYISGSKPDESGDPQVDVVTESSSADQRGRLYWQQMR